MPNDQNKLTSGLAVVDLSLQKVEFCTASIGAIVVFFMMLAGAAEIFLRSLFNSPIPGYLEAVEISIVAFAVLPISYCYQRDGHLKMDLIVRRSSGRRMWIYKTFATATALAFILIILPSLFDFYRNSLVLGDSTMNMEWPIWPSKLAAVVGLCVFAMRLAIELVASLRMLADPNATEIALPKQADPLKEAID